MTRLWMLPSTSAVILSALLAAGCSDRGTDAANPDQNAAVEAPEDGIGAAKVPDTPTDRPAPAGDDSAVTRDTDADADADGARATTGRRDPAPRRTEAAPRVNANRREAVTRNPRTGTAARSDASPAPRRGAEYREVTIPEGTALPLELITPLSSETAQPETRVQARLRQGVVVNGVTALPAGTVLVGEVTEVERAGRVKGRSRVSFRFSETQVYGAREELRTNALTFEGEASKGEDATKIGAGAVGGAIVGGIIGGGDGAAKGAAIGGAAGTGVVLATRGKEVKLGSGTDLAASLAEPLRIRVPVR